MSLDKRNDSEESATAKATSVLAEELAAMGLAQKPRLDAQEAGLRIGFSRNGDLAQAAKHNLFGLAFSGGGIRSATFNLGIIQALADVGMLAQAHYLSTVSGGGYIGSWLTAWVHRSGGIANVQKRLVRSVEPTAELENRPYEKLPNPEPISSTPSTEAQAAAREQSAISFLREHSNYLTPRVGLFGADTWSAVSIYLRNLTLNLTILVGVLLVVILLPRVLWICSERLSQGNTADYLAGGFLLFAAIASGINLRRVRKPPRQNNQRATEIDGPDKPSRPVNPDASKQPRARGERKTWKQWVAEQNPVLVLIVVPTVLAAFFVAAGIPQAQLDRWPERAALAAGYVTLWFVLVVVWRPKPDDSARSRSATIAVALLGAVFAGALVVALIAACAASKLSEDSVAWITFGVPIVLAIFSLSVILHLGVMGRAVSEEVREWWGRLGAWVLIVTLVWIPLFGLSLFGPLLVDMAGAKLKVPAALTWLTTTGFGIWAGRSPTTNGKRGGSAFESLASVAPYVFVLGLLLMLSIAADRTLLALFSHQDVVTGHPWDDWSYHWDRLYAVHLGPILASMGACLAVAILLSRRVDVNDFSLQPFYRNRLVRCYLGASNDQRTAHPFTGFDPDDDIPLAGLAPPGDPDNARILKPYPLINVALNLVKGERLAWQERKAASFTMAPLHCGFGDSYRRTAEYAGGRLTLGAAFATSGAAASPNMGYHSNPALAFLMTVFNVRLGLWLANPKNEKWASPGPKLGLLYLLSELFGNTSERSNYVYLSDGGHFDNLGIYELVRRRCRFIVACDASADPQVHFDDLGSVIRKCRTDFGVDVVLDTISLQPDPATRHCRYHCAMGKVNYPEGTFGTLLYLKASLTGREPVDVLNYAAGDVLFPHQSTADQWFSESQFESYRRLGHHCGKTVFDAVKKDLEKGKPLESIFTSLRERWYPPTAVAPGTFTAHAAALIELNERMRSNPSLSFLDAQIYPSWPELMAGTKFPSPQLWLPPDADARREGFYFCTALIQLMENVYTDLNLGGTQFDHPDNRGWVNLFRHWSWCGMLRITWALTAATYGARFQTFCRERLDLDTGSVRVETVDEQKLNAIERGLVKNLREKRPAGELTLYSVLLCVPNPMSDPGKTEEVIFTVGFAVTLDHRLAYLRIQNHLRRMGLAGETMDYMAKSRMILGDRLEEIGLKSEHEDSDDRESLRHLFESAWVKQKAAEA